MTKYNFLLKPVFYIFSLLFATWMVIKIEQISPSDFGGHDSKKPKEIIETKKTSDQKKLIKRLFLEYKSGSIDSTELDKKLDYIFNSEGNYSTK